MKKLLALILTLSALALPAAARADSPGLQVDPLQYEDTLTGDKTKLGYIEVANPSDTTLSLQANVQGFRQAGTDGHLTFFDDPEISAGIKVDLPSFTLGPREAIRVAFTVDPAKLPKGGVYAVIFFRTIPPAQVSGSSYVSESASIGTLLLLQNGAPGAHIGTISQLQVPFWQFGNGLTGRLTFANTDRSRTAAGFRPALSAQVLPWGRPQTLPTGLVLPSSERQFVFERRGAYFGLLPVTVREADTHAYATAWVFACTGWYQWAALVMIFTLVLLLALRPRGLARRLRRFWLWLGKRLRRRRQPVRRSIDGLSIKR